MLQKTDHTVKAKWNHLPQLKGREGLAIPDKSIMFNLCERLYYTRLEKISPQRIRRRWDSTFTGNRMKRRGIHSEGFFTPRLFQENQKSGSEPQENPIRAGLTNVIPSLVFAECLLVWLTRSTNNEAFLNGTVSESNPGSQLKMKQNPQDIVKLSKPCPCQVRTEEAFFFATYLGLSSWRTSKNILSFTYVFFLRSHEAIFLLQLL